MALVYCPECGTQSSDQALACPKCAYPISKLNNNQNVKSTNENGIIKNIKGLAYYYEQEFEEIYRSKESYKGTLNWTAFLFTPIWCFIKELWVHGIIITACHFMIYFFVPAYFINKDTGSFTPKYYLLLLFGLLMSFYMLSRATWLLYNLKVKDKLHFDIFFVFLIICIIGLTVYYGFFVGNGEGTELNDMGAKLHF